MSASIQFPDTAYGGNFGPHWLLRYARPDAEGEVITFYSYKGGTGRSMALANCAGLMAESWPKTAKPILLVDFDLEAPGLHEYFREYLPLGENLLEQNGVLELFQDLHQQVDTEIATRKANGYAGTTLDEESCHKLMAKFDFAPYLITSTLQPVFLIKAGRFDDSYTKRLSAMHWQGLYNAAPGIFRALAARWAQDYACTLIDSRTGLSDTSSICTMLLPDVLTVVFTPNRQSLTGIWHLIREAKTYRANSVDLRPLRIYPLPSRVEQTSEDYRQIWRHGTKQAHHIFGEVNGYQALFSNLLHEFGDAEVPAATLEAGLNNYFDLVQVPHSPDYAFGERLCFGRQTSTDRLSLRTAFETFLPWLVTGAEASQAPGRRLQQLQLEDWLAALLPPESDDGVAFATWLSKAQAACEGAATPGFAVARDALAAYGKSTQVDDGPQEAMMALLPAATLIQALAWMQGQQWDKAIELFERLNSNVRQFGLSSDWQDVPRRWLRHCHAKPNFSFLAGWLDSTCAVAMEDWVDSASIARSHAWAWAEQLLAIYYDFEVTGDRANRLLEQRQAILGDEHPDTLRSMNLLARALHALGDDAAARKLQEQALAIMQRILGNEHTETLNGMSNLAAILLAQGELAEARKIAAQVLASRTQTLGERDPATLSSLAELAEIHSELGELETAHQQAEQALAGLNDVLGTEHLYTLLAMKTLANVKFGMKDFRGGIRLQIQVQDGYKRNLGDKHPVTIAVGEKLASAQRDAQIVNQAAAVSGNVSLEAHAYIGGGVNGVIVSTNNNMSSNAVISAELTGAPLVKEVLGHLLIEIEILKQRPLAQQQSQIADMSSDADILINEITRPKPRQRWLQASLSGIADAAQALGEHGKAVLERAQQLENLLLEGNAR